MTHQPQDGAAPDRRAENREVAVRLLAERCRLQARQAVLEPAVGIPLMTGVIVMLHPAIGADQLVPWALLLGATLLLRAFCAARFIARRRYDTADYLTLTAVFNLTAGLSGLLVGACAGLFFAQVTHADRLSLTIVIFAWLALGVLMYAPFSRHGLLHGGAVLAQLAVAWLLAPEVPGALIALGVVLYGALLARLSVVLSRALTQSIRRKHRIRQLARRLEEQRAQAVRASKSSARFLAAASHDLRQPATSLGLLSALVRERCTDPALHPLIAAIDRSATTISDLLSSLLDLSRLESNAIQPHFEWLSVDELFETLREEFAVRAEQKALTLVVASAPIRVLADRMMLTRLLRNLLDNAVRFTDQGAITLAASEGPRCVLSVTDTGIGIAPDQLDRIFEEHVRIASPGRRSPPGLGLGLAMVSRIAQLLSAQITAYSDGSRGSRFELVFPSDRVAPDTSPQAAIVELEPQASGPDHSAHEPAARRPISLVTAPRALLVDDDPEVASALQSLLEARGWHTDIASNATEAFARISGSDCWQLLLADCRMGAADDGLSLALAARLVRPDLRCVLMSADTSAALQHRASDHGLSLIRKPVSEQTLFAAIRIR